MKFVLTRIVQRINKGKPPALEKLSELQRFVEESQEMISRIKDENVRNEKYMKLKPVIDINSLIIDILGENVLKSAKIEKLVKENIRLNTAILELTEKQRIEKEMKDF